MLRRSLGDGGRVLPLPYFRSELRFGKLKLNERVIAAGFRCGLPGYYIFFPQVLRRLRPLERALKPLPLGGQYYVRGQC